LSRSVATQYDVIIMYIVGYAIEKPFFRTAKMPPKVNIFFFV